MNSLFPILTTLFSVCFLASAAFAAGAIWHSRRVTVTKCPQCKTVCADLFDFDICPSCARLNELAARKLTQCLAPPGYCVYCHDQLPSWNKNNYGACPECVASSAGCQPAVSPIVNRPASPNPSVKQSNPL